MPVLSTVEGSRRLCETWESGGMTIRCKALFYLSFLCPNVCFERPHSEAPRFRRPIRINQGEASYQGMPLGMP